MVQVGGTTVGAGILAIPAETQPAGFVASSATVLVCWMYMVSLLNHLKEVFLQEYLTTIMRCYLLWHADARAEKCFSAFSRLFG